MSEEQRRFDRYLLVTEIEQCRRDGKEDYSRATSKNISKGGICITTENTPLIQGEIYKLRFILTGRTKQIVVDAKVTWTNQYTWGKVPFFDNGLEFMNISQEQLDMIEEYRLGSVYEK